MKTRNRITIEEVSEDFASSDREILLVFVAINKCLPPVGFQFLLDISTVVELSLAPSLRKIPDLYVVDRRYLTNTLVGGRCEVDVVYY